VPGKRQSEAERREAIIRAAFEVACRDQLGGLSMRAVAEAAGVSKGLVFFYYGDRDTLLRALLDWLLETTLVLEGPEEAPTGEGPSRRLLALVRREVEKLPEDRSRVELFLDFWVRGRGAPEIQERIRRAFARYREGFLTYTEPVVAQAPERFGPEGARGLASVVVSFIEGCALQLIADPDRFDVERDMRAVRGLVVR
jgi:TetR/AcrR family transcriptional repressor of bet genes